MCDERDLQEIKNNNIKIRILVEQFTSKVPLLDLIWDKVDIIMFYKDKDNNMNLVNNFFCKIAKVDKEDIEGFNLNDIMSKTHRVKKYFSNDLDVLTTGIPKIGIIEKFMDTDITVRTDKFPVFDREQIIGILGMSIIIND